MVLRHNQLHAIKTCLYIFATRRTLHGVKVEAGSALTPDLSRSRPVYVLVNNWRGGIPATFDITVTPPLTPVSLREASSQREQPLDWQSRGSTRLMTQSVTLLDDTASL